jgi:dTDP-4-amino-4,6-dideoxygalactose transaminase
MQITATEFLPFSRALIEEEEINAVAEVMRCGWLTTGARVREFEAAFKEYVGSQNAVAVSSCTAALHLSLAAIGIQEGDEVIIPTMTFASTGEVVSYFKARPVLVDCAPDTFHIDPKEIERAITPRTKAIIPVHYAGHACDMDAILDLAQRHEIKVIEDAAHALPAQYQGRMVGTMGDISCFSFYPTKTMTTGEGGMVTTANQEYAERIRMLSLHGISKDAWKRYSAEGSWRYDILETGYKYNLTDIQAAIGVAQLQKIDRMRARRAYLAKKYDSALGGFDAFRLPTTPEGMTHAWHLYVIQVQAAALTIGRDQVIEELKRRGIGTSVHFIPLHLHSLYQQLGYRSGQFPQAEARFEGAISIPLFAAMRDEDCDRVIEGLQDIAREFKK